MKFRDRKIRQECVKQSVGHTVPGCQLTVTVGHPGSCVPLSAVSHIQYLKRANVMVKLKIFGEDMKSWNVGPEILVIK